MATPDVRVRLSAEGQKEVVDAFRRIQAESEKAGKRQATGFLNFNKVLKGTVGLLGAVGAGFTAVAAFRGAQKGISILREWETSFAEVKTIAGGTEEQLDRLERRVLALGTIIPQDASLLSAGLYQTLSSGITDTADALFFLTRAGKAAVGGITEVDVAVDVGSSILNAFQKDIRETDQVFDALFTTVREGKVTFPQLAGSLGPAIPIFAQAGFQLEELLAGVATLTKGGFPAEQAVTSLRDAIVKLIKPTTDQLAAARELGVEFTAEAAAAKGLVGFLKDVADKTDGSAEAIARLFPDVRGMVGVLALAGNQWEEFDRILEEIQDPLGASQAAFERMSETQAAQEQLMRNRLKNAWIEFGRTIQEQGKNVLTVVGQLLPKTFEEQVETLEKLGRQIERVDRRGARLVQRYEELAAQGVRTAEEQAEMARTMQQLAAEFPQLIEEMDEFGNVTKINTGFMSEFREELERLRALQAGETFATQAARAEELRQEIQDLTGELNKLAGREGLEALETGIVRTRAGGRIGGGVTKLVRDERIALNTAVLKARAELQEVEGKLAQDVIAARLAPEVLAFEQLAANIDAGVVPSAQLDDALEGVSDQLKVLLQTADPKELEKRLRDMAAMLRKFDPELRFLGEQLGPEEAPPPAAPGKAEQLIPPELTEAFDESARRQRQAMADFLNESFGTDVTEGFIASLKENRPDLFSFFSKLFAQSQAAGFDLEGRILQATGQKFEADLRRIEAEIQAADQKLRQQGVADAERIAQLERLNVALTNVAKFEEARRQARAALADVERTRTLIESEIEAGLITQEEGEQRILDIERERIVVLKQLADALLAAAKATGDPALIAQAEDFAVALSQIGVGAKDATVEMQDLGTTLEESSTRALADFFDTGIEGSKKFKDSLRDMVLAVIADLRRLAAELIAIAILRKIAGFAGGGSPGGEGDKAEKKARGGMLGGLGSGTSDSNLAWFSRGEFLVRAAVVQEPGVLGHLKALNAGGRRAVDNPRVIGRGLVGYAEGGLVQPAASQISEDGRLLIGLEEGLLVRALDTAAGRKVLVRALGKSRRAGRAALGI